MADDSKLFEWYKMIVELGRFEVEHGRTRFYETTKLHFAVMGAILALGAYALAQKDIRILILPVLAAIFGLLHAASWLRQLSSSSTWEARWYLSAAEIEDSKAFRKLVGDCDVQVWSHKDVRAKLNPETKRQGASPSSYRYAIHSIMAIYCACICLAIVQWSR